MIPDSLFSSSQSPCFSLLKVPFSSFSQCPVSSSPSSSILSKSSPILLKFPFPSSPIPVPILPVLFHPLKVLSPPLPRIIEKQRNDPKPSRRSWLWCGVVTYLFVLKILEDVHDDFHRPSVPEHFVFLRIRALPSIPFWDCLKAGTFSRCVSPNSFCSFYNFIILIGSLRLGN